MVLVLSCRDTQYLDQPIGERSVLQRVADFAASVPQAAQVLVCGPKRPGDLPADWVFVPASDESLKAFVLGVADTVGGEDPEVLVARLESPFLDAGLAERLLRRHRTYAADFTLAEGFPGGMSLQVVHGRILARLRELAGQTTCELGNDLLFPAVQRDINAFDIETELCADDLRLLRVSLTADTVANLELCRRVAQEAGDSLPAIVDWLPRNRTAHRTLPRYVQIQILEQEVQHLSYSPYPNLRTDPTAPGAILGLDALTRIRDQLCELSPEATVAISLWGEAALHPQVGEVIRLFTSDTRLSLIVETSGVGWEEATLRGLLADPPRRLSVIVGLDSNDAATYTNIRGEGFAEATAFARRMLAALPHGTYVQAVRTAETEPTLSSFYQEWTQLTRNVIIQKHDDFCGVLPKHDNFGMKPLFRPPCWHLQRDLVITVGGDVPMCREDLRLSQSRGNVFEHSIATIWEAGAEEYRDHSERRYAPLCARCDEYYTFNA